MIQTKKDAATIRGAIQKLRSFPAPVIGQSVVKQLTPEQSYFAMLNARAYVELYVVPELLALLPTNEKPK